MSHKIGTEKKVKICQRKTTKERPSMEDEAWNSRVEDVETFFESRWNHVFSSDETIEDGVELIRMNIRRGNELQSGKHFGSKSLMKAVNGRKNMCRCGNGLAIFEIHQIFLLMFKPIFTTWLYAALIIGTITKLFKLLQFVQVATRRRQPYDAEEYAKTRAFAMKQRFVKLFNDGRWDGNYSLEDGMTIALPPAKEEGEEDVSDDAWGGRLTVKGQ